MAQQIPVVYGVYFRWAKAQPTLVIMVKFTFSQSGVTLLELMCCIAILALLTTFAVTGGSDILAKYEVRQRSQAIQSAVRYARFLAYSQGQTYVLSPLSEEKNWSYGMQLHKMESVAISSPKHTIIYTWRWNNTRAKVQWIGAQSKQYIMFTPFPNHAMCSGHFEIKIKKFKNTIVLNRLGRLIETEDANETG